MFVFLSTIKASIQTTPALYNQVQALIKIIFYHGLIYRISVCFVFPSTVKV